METGFDFTCTILGLGLGVGAVVLLQAPLFSSDPPWYSNKFLLDVSIVKFARITSTVCDLAMMASVFDNL